MRALLCSLTLFVWGATAAPAFAQPPPAPPKVWTVAVSAGLALTSGNTDTSTINARRRRLQPVDEERREVGRVIPAQHD